MGLVHWNSLELPVNIVLMCCTMVCAGNGFELQVIDLMVLRMVCAENGIEYNTYNTSLRLN